VNDDLLPEADGQQGEAEVPTPFSFKLMIALTVIYLGWRLVQGIIWLIDQLA
jgi:hypothetical protein